MRSGPEEASAAAGAAVRRRSAGRTRVTVVLPLLLSATAMLLLPSVSVAADDPKVTLPVMAGRLAADAPCTKESTTTVKAVPWEHRSLELPRAVRLSEGAGVKVAVVDTGVSTEASALAGRVETLGSAGDDCVGHGTFAAGLIAAAPSKGAAFYGVAPRARIIGVRGTDERGTPTADTVALGIRAAVDAGAEIVEVSAALGASSTALDEAVAHAAKHDALVVAAAVPDPPSGSTGSGSTPAPRDYWPAAAAGVLSVVDLNVQGERPDNALLPVHADLAAPGDGVVGVGPRGSGHFVGSGASYAAAYAAGAAALVRSSFPDLSAARVAERLTATAYPDSVPRLDAYAAVAASGDGERVGQAATGARDTVVRLPDRSPRERATRTAMLVTAFGAGAVLVVGWAAVVIPRGRARGWRPPRV